MHEDVIGTSATASADASFSCTIGGVQPNADDRLMREMIQRIDRDLLPAVPHPHHNAGGSVIMTRIGVGLKPLQGLLTCGQLEMTKITSISAVIST
jgi:hypothetical protein